jgi:hypothetical protein
MSFFYNLNKRLADLAAKQDLTESVQSEAKTKRLPGLPITQKDVEKKFGGSMIKMAQAAKEAGFSDARITQAMDDLKQGKNPNDVDESALQAYLGKKKYGEQGMKALQKAGRDGASKEKMAKIRAAHDKMDEADMEEGNAFTGALAKTPKGGKFKVGNKEFTDTSDLEEGFKEMDAWLTAREKEKGTGRYDKKKISTGTVYTRKPETFDDPETDSEATGGAPKRRGRPKGKDKGPERVTAKSYKYKTGRPAKTDEDLDTDGVMMTRQSNMSSESADPADRGEYDREGEMAKHDIKTIVRHAQALHKILGDNDNLPEWVQSKLAKIEGMMTSVDDYMQNQTDEEMKEGWRGGLAGERPLMKTRRSGAETAYEEIVSFLKSPQSGIEPVARQHLMKLVNELARQATKTKEVPVVEKAKSKAQQKFMGMVHAAQKGERPASGAVAKVAKSMGKKDAEDFAATKHKGLPEKVKTKKTEEAKPDFLDIDKDGDKKESMKKAASEKKEKKVEETSTDSTSSKGGYNFGGGVYENFNSKVENIITEGMNITVNMAAGDDGEPRKSITITADGAEADQLAELLKMAGLGSQSDKQETCSSCGESACACDQEMVDENSPDWPTDQVTSDDALQYSGGLNKPKSTGQTTVPVVASQLRRQVSMEENVELERSLFKLYKDISGK